MLLLDSSRSCLPCGEAASVWPCQTHRTCNKKPRPQHIWRSPVAAKVVLNFNEVVEMNNARILGRSCEGAFVLCPGGEQHAVNAVVWINRSLPALVLHRQEAMSPKSVDSTASALVQRINSLL